MTNAAPFSDTEPPDDDDELIVVDIPRPDDWHVHLRDDDMLAAVAGCSAKWFRNALVMPNLQPPVVTVAAAVAYRARILEAAAASGVSSQAVSQFAPRMTLYLTPEITAEDLRAGAASGDIAAVKFYPAGATTNSEAGGTDLASFGPQLDVMAELGLPLLVHAESTDPSIDIFDREAAFLADQVHPLLLRMPALSVTVEHISTAAGIDLVAEFENTFGSITPHHLSCDRSDLLANGMRPELYCKPVINSADNRHALVQAATRGDPKFFLGTDSAPHPLSAKEAQVVKAGIFNAPYALEVTAEVFYQAGCLDQLAAFTSVNGARRYGHPVADTYLRLTRRSAPDPTREARPTLLTTPSGDEVRLFGLNEANHWTVSEM